MPDAINRERDLVLAPNEFAFISDQTKGHVVVYMGPTKTSLANTDQPVLFNVHSKRFERSNLDNALSVFSTAPEGWYLVLKNPAKDGQQPRSSGPNNLPELNIGRKVNIPGPISFANWPGQMVRIVKGHNLKTNQYLLVRVYDEEAAKENWGKAVIKPQTAPIPIAEGKVEAGGEAKPKIKLDREIPELTMGKLLIIKGTDISFYMPPTGVEVVRDQKDCYVREAVTLERLEYCILLDEDGNKRFIEGPAVVFPKPTECFVERNGTRKFKAIELNEISGIYVKVIAPYKEKDKEYMVGQELFITGKERMIYFPRPEHAIIKYGDQEIHYAVAIPAGEGRYVLNRLTGIIELKRGPSMLLPDPRYEVIVRRVLDEKECLLWFPGNQEALDYNKKLKMLSRGEVAEHLPDRIVKRRLAQQSQNLDELQIALLEESGTSLVGDDFTRSTKFSAPRTITLDTKYEGAIAIDIWTGYAVLVVGRMGQRQVVVGPKTYLLGYDENLEAMGLSTGTPKNDDQRLQTGYLRVLHNKVSDIVTAETRDLCNVRVKLSYRVSFEGDSEKWFNVENYVKFLTDHMRSLLRNAIKKISIEDFYADSISVVRDTVLGDPVEEGKRRGRTFSENGMRIYDVEVLDVQIGDAVIGKLLIEAQHAVVKQNLEITAENRRLHFIEEAETIKQKIAQAETQTRQDEMEIKTIEAEKETTLNLAQMDAEIITRQRALEAKDFDQIVLSKIDQAERDRLKENKNLQLELAQRQLELKLQEQDSEVAAVVNKAKAISPDLISALQAFGDRALAEKMAESMAPLAILGGNSVADVFSQLIKGTALEVSLRDKSKIPALKK